MLETLTEHPAFSTEPPIFTTTEPPALIFTTDEQNTPTQFEPPPFFPEMDEETYNAHVHYSKIMSYELKWATKVDITPNRYFSCLREYIQETQEGTLFEGWDLDKYTVYYLTRVANENRNSVRNNWEAMGKGMHKAEWFDNERYKPEEKRMSYQELTDTIYREGM
jgi:hypothetical protein